MHQILYKKAPCDRDTEIDNMLFSDESNSEFAKMDTGTTMEDLTSHSKVKNEHTELDEFLLDADSLRACFSKQIKLDEYDETSLLRQNSAK